MATKSKTPKQATVDAQEVKKALLAVVKKIGNSKRLTAGQLFGFMLESIPRD